MALFKSRKSADEASSAPPSESIEAMRRRARHRLIGASMLVLVGVVGFPLLFDTQPRPIPVDIPIEIPDRNKVKPLAVPALPAPQASGVVAAASVPAQKAPEKVEVAKVEAAKPEPKPEPKAEAKPEPKPEVKTEAKPDDGARAQALLEGKLLDEPIGTDGRFVVQVGAFTDANKVRETRLKVERAGMKTYTHVAETKEGKLIRVRVGPFATRAEADRAAEKIKGLELQARILTL
ncbi:MAG: SPOR domain-containing protein [Burkholderiales bacterium]|nr:SPOR domain-containing protein [Burkholderiales bacterium]